MSEIWCQCFSSVKSVCVVGPCVWFVIVILILMLEKCDRGAERLPALAVYFFPAWLVMRSPCKQTVVICPMNKV